MLNAKILDLASHIAWGKVQEMRSAGLLPEPTADALAESVNPFLHALSVGLAARDKAKLTDEDKQAIADAQSKIEAILADLDEKTWAVDLDYMGWVHDLKTADLDPMDRRSKMTDLDRQRAELKDSHKRTADDLITPQQATIDTLHERVDAAGHRALCLDLGMSPGQYDGQDDSTVREVRGSAKALSPFSEVKPQYTSKKVTFVFDANRSTMAARDDLKELDPIVLGTCPARSRTAVERWAWFTVNRHAFTNERDLVQAWSEVRSIYDQGNLTSSAAGQSTGGGKSVKDHQTLDTLPFTFPGLSDPTPIPTPEPEPTE